MITGNVMTSIERCPSPHHEAHLADPLDVLAKHTTPFTGKRDDLCWPKRPSGYLPSAVSRIIKQAYTVPHGVVNRPCGAVSSATVVAAL